VIAIPAVMMSNVPASRPSINWPNGRCNTASRVVMPRPFNTADATLRRLTGELAVGVQIAERFLVRDADPDRLIGLQPFSASVGGRVHSRPRARRHRRR